MCLVLEYYMLACLEFCPTWTSYGPLYAVCLVVSSEVSVRHACDPAKEFGMRSTMVHCPVIDSYPVQALQGIQVQL